MSSEQEKEQGKGKGKEQGKEQGKGNEKNGKMQRNLGTASVFAICTGAMFSSGFFLLPGLAAETSGPSIPLVYLFASLLMLPAIFTLGELSSAIPRAGGPYLFLNRSMSSLMGLIGSFAYYIQLLLKGAFAFVGVGAYLSLLVEVPIQPVAIALIVFFTALNLLGAQQTARTEIILVTILLLLLTYFVVSGLVEVNVGGAETRAQFQPLFPFGLEGVFSGIALVFISYGGIGQVASLAEEVKDPSRSIPRGMLMAIGVATIFYFLGTAIMVALLDPNALHDDQVPVATAAAQFRELPLPVTVVVCAALAAFASTGNAAILSAARYPLAMARDRLIWQKFGQLGPKGIPKLSVIFTGLMHILLVLAFDVENIAKFGSAFLLFVFLGICVALIIFRESRTDEYKPAYRSPLYPWTQILGIVIYLALIIESGLEAIALIMAVCLSAALWYFWGTRDIKNQSAAIYTLFGRLARHGTKNSSASEIGMPVMAGTGLTQLSERALVQDLDGEASLEEAVDKAAHALKNHVGGKQEAIAEHLQQEVSHWKSPSRSNVLISPALLQGIEQPELIIIRGSIHINEHHYEGLIVLVDDEESSERLLNLLSQLEGVIYHSDFPHIWRDAKGAQELKDALKHDIKTVQSLTLKLNESGPAASLHDTCIKDVELPEGSLVVLVQREGQTFVPDGDTTFQRGDSITIVANNKAMDKLKEKFSTDRKV